MSTLPLLHVHIVQWNFSTTPWVLGEILSIHKLLFRTYASALNTEVSLFQGVGNPLYTEVSLFQGVGIMGIHCIQKFSHFRSWNSGYPLYTEVSSFQEVPLYTEISLE